MSSEKKFIPLNVAVLTVSDTRTIETDTSGGYLACVFNACQSVSVDC